jgi:RNA methyltransferase, TrmH family
MKEISSRHNPLVRTFRTLAERPDPSGARLLLDGVHLLRDAHRAGARIEVVVVGVREIEAATEAGRLARTLHGEGIEVLAASDRVLDAVSPVRTPSGIVALVSRPPADPAGICAAPDAFVVMAAGVQDPGNLGSLLRAAEAAGATGCLVTGSSASPFSWKALRGSMGSALRLPVAAGLATTDALAVMQRAGLRIVAAVPRAGRDPDAIDWRHRIGLIVGGEGPGLPADVAARCDDRVTIPMHPAVESLNVAVATGVLCYAARRQRVVRPPSPS